MKTPSGSTRVLNVRHGRRLQRHMRTVQCGESDATITHEHAYYCGGEWLLPERDMTEIVGGVPSVDVAAIETENYCEDRLMMASGLEVETWDGRAIASWRPHTYQTGERRNCALPGSEKEKMHEVRSVMRDLHNV